MRYLFLFPLILIALLPVAHGADPVTPKLMLANVYHDDIQLSEYWVSEKLDGVRAYWNGEHLLSRNGNIFHAPDWFIEGFPNTPLDGELWGGRGTFEHTVSAVRKDTPINEEWQQLRYKVFDLPKQPGNFDQRLKALRELMAAQSSPYLSLVEQQRIRSHQVLQTQLNQRVAQGAEGLMLHKGSADYRAMRSDDLLKLKLHEDAEAIVLAHIPGQGKYTGMLGSLLVETRSGKRFKIGTGFSDQQRRSPPAIGATITYKYFGKTDKGIPRFASFLRERPEE